jgi:hypothetical protein
MRPPGMGIAAKGGHPSQYIGSSSNLLIRIFFRDPFVSTPDEAQKFVVKQVKRKPTTSRSLLRMEVVMSPL